MKRLHIHIAVKDLEESRHYYTALYGCEPTKVKDDYLQWLIDDPAINFAISSGRDIVGLNHLGMQVDSDEELAIIEDRLVQANLLGEKQEEAQCCYASSKKYWSEDPQGIVWENYHTMEQIEFFGGDSFTGGTGCCEPSFSKKSETSSNGKWATGPSC
jgi:catechol-2,3-dioxygenase